MVDEQSPRARAGSWPLVATFLAAGTLHWLLFFGLPPVLPRESADWPKEFRYYAVLKQAVTEGRVPYFVSVSLQDTRKFLAIPETVLSPQILLLRWLSVDTFFLLHVLLLQAIGLAGCLAIGRRYHLSLPSFALLWLLLGFNGHVTAHLAIGHSMWGGYFFLPWFFLLVLRLVEAPSPRPPIGVGLVLGLMLLQGSFHTFVCCVLFLALLFLLDGASRRWSFAALAWTAGFTLFRLVPAAVILLGRRARDFQTGYASVADLLAGLVWIHDVQLERRGGGSMGGLRWWEFDAYIGIAALVWLLVAGIGWGLVRRSGPYRRLAAPMAIVALLSLDGLYRPLSLSPIPLLDAERVSSRLLIVPLGLLIVIAAIAGEEWLRLAPSRRRIYLSLMGVATALLLGAHSLVWSVPSVTRLLPPPPHARDLSIQIVESSGEPKDALYVLSVQASAILSLGVAALALIRSRSREG
jgi:hypothetical protein